MIEREPILARLDESNDIQRELETILQTLVLNDSTIVDALAQMLGAVQRINARVDLVHRMQAGNSEDLRTIIADLAATLGTVARPGRPHSAAPVRDAEFALLEHLCAFVEDRSAIDVGAHAGDLSARLLDIGMTVAAFEPYEPSFDALTARLHGRPGFHASPYAVGAVDGDATLHIATDTTRDGAPATLFNSLIVHPLGTQYAFTSSMPVRVRRLDTLRASGDIPERIGVLKIDTEGADIDVIAGLGSCEPSIVMTEYWDAQHPFGASGNGDLAKIVGAMRERGYGRHVVIYHGDNDTVVSYTFDRSEPPPTTWGNAIFFRDRALFAHAAAWCEAVLRPHVA